MRTVPVLRRRDVVITSILSVAIALAPSAHAARAAVDNDPPTITHTPAPCPAAVDGVVPACLVEATIADPSGVFDPTLLVRLRGVSAYERVPMKAADPTRADVYVATVPAAIAAAGDVEYLIEAFDVEGNGPARAGEEAAPLVLVKAAAPVVVAPPVEPPPVAESDDDGGLLLGVVIGVGVLAVVAAGAVVGVALYATRPAAVDEVTVSVSGPRPFAVTP